VRGVEYYYFIITCYEGGFIYVYYYLILFSQVKETNVLLYYVCSSSSCDAFIMANTLIKMGADLSTSTALHSAVKNKFCFIIIIVIIIIFIFIYYFFNFFLFLFFNTISPYLYLSLFFLSSPPFSLIFPFYSLQFPDV
jgi:hypothetical protein